MHNQSSGISDDLSVLQIRIWYQNLQSYYVDNAIKMQIFHRKQLSRLCDKLFKDTDEYQLQAVPPSESVFLQAPWKAHPPPDTGSNTDSGILPPYCIRR